MEDPARDRAQAAIQAALSRAVAAALAAGVRPTDLVEYGDARVAALLCSAPADPHRMVVTNMTAPEPGLDGPLLDERIAELEALLPLAPPSTPDLAIIAGQLASLLRDRAERDGDDASVDRSLAVTEYALARLNPDNPSRPDVLAEKAMTLQMRYDRRGDMTDLETVIAIWRELADSPTPDGDVSVAEALANLGLALWLRHQRLVADGSDDDAVGAALDEAQQVLHTAVNAAPADSPLQAIVRCLLGFCWAKRYEREGDPRQLDHAVAEVEAAARTLDEPLEAEHYGLLASLRHTRAAAAWAAAGHETTERVRADLAAARDWIRAGLDAVDPGDPERVDLLWVAATIAGMYAASSIDDADLAELSAWTGELVAHVDAIDPHGTTDEATAAHMIHGRVLAEMSLRSGPAGVPPAVTQGLHDAMPYVTRFLAASGGGHLAFDPEVGDRIGLLVRPDRAPELAAQLMELWRGLPPGPERGVVAGALATMLFVLNQQGAIELDLAETIAMATEALSAHPDDEAWQTQIRLVLATLQAYGALSIDPALAHQAIDTLAKIRSTDPDIQRDVLGVLTNALQVRGATTREITDIAAALSATDELSAGMSPDDERYPTVRVQAGSLRIQLGIARDDRTLVRDGIEILQGCVDTLPRNDTRLVVALTNLAVAEAWLGDEGAPKTAERLAARIRAAEGAAGVTSDIRLRLDLARSVGPLLAQDLRGASAMVDALRDQAREADDTYVGLRRRLAAGGGLAFRAMLVRSPEDADAAVQELEKAQAQLAGDVKHPLWSETAIMLGRGYRTRAELTGPGPEQAADRDRGRHYGLLALRGQSWRALVQSTTDNAVAAAREAADLALEVAGWCITDRAATDAAVALDAGRGLILHAASVTPGLGQVPADATAVAADPRSRRLLAIVEEAESRGARILDPPLVTDVRRALRRLGAHALVYLVPRTEHTPPVAVFVPERGKPAIVDLPVVGPAPDRFVEALASTDIRHRDLAVAAPPAPGLREALPALTDWAWEVAMSRVLDHCRVSGFARPYRLVLVPMGQLGIIPWHAARSPAGRFALQDAVISYAASARLLCDVAGRTRISPDRGGLIVGDPTGDLVHAGAEAMAIRDRFYPDGHYLGPPGSPSPATPEAVLSWLASTVADPGGVLHLACHGVVEVGAANSSRLILADGGVLSAERLVESADWAPGACQLGLVCLAACSTGVAARGYDEAFSLATAFQVAGARSVVSSLWRVPDEATSLLMYLLHHYLVEERVGPAEALRLAQLWMLDPERREPAGMPSALRSRLARLDSDDVSAWAGFVHHGQW